MVVWINDVVAGVSCVWLGNDAGVGSEKIEACCGRVHSRVLGDEC